MRKPQHQANLLRRIFQLPPPSSANGITLSSGVDSSVFTYIRNRSTWHLDSLQIPLNALESIPTAVPVGGGCARRGGSWRRIVRRSIDCGVVFLEAKSRSAMLSRSDRPVVMGKEVSVLTCHELTGNFQAPFQSRGHHETRFSPPCSPAVLLANVVIPSVEKLPLKMYRAPADVHPGAG